MTIALLSDSGLSTQLFGFVAGSYSLNFVAAAIRRTTLGSLFAFVICCAAAYATGCAIEICVMQITGAPPVRVWLLISLALVGASGFAIVETAKPNGWLATIPCCAIGALMVAHGSLTELPLGQYPPFLAHPGLPSGVIMIVLGIVAGLVVGAGHDRVEVSRNAFTRALQHLRFPHAWQLSQRYVRPVAAAVEWDNNQPQPQLADEWIRPRTQPRRQRAALAYLSRLAVAGGETMVQLYAAAADASAQVTSARRSPLRQLYIQVLLAIAAGILLGHFYPGLGAQMKPLSDGFIMLIRSVVPPIIFVTVAVGIAKMGDMRRVGVVGLRALIYFEIVSTLALLTGLGVGHLLQPGAGLHINPSSLNGQAVAGFVASAKSFTLVEFLMKMIPHNLIGALTGGDMLPVLVISVLFGFALCQMGELGQRLVGLLDDAMQALFGIVRIVMYLAPLAAFGAMAFTVGKFGFGMLASLGQLLASVYLTSILFVLVGFGLIARLFGLRLWPIIRYFKDELLITFSATSGEAMIPRSIAKLRRVGCAEETVGLVLPTGFSFNTDGSAIYMTMALLFIAQATDIHLTFGQELTMLFVMLFTSKGAAGVAGAGFVALAATMPALGILPVGGLALLLGVERFMSEIRAVTNLFSNIFATIVISKWMGELDDRHYRRALAGGDDEALAGLPARL